MKLVSNKKKIRFPRSTTSIKNILRDAAIKANKENWNKIIIITKDKEGYVGCGWSAMTPMDRISMCEYAKEIAMRELMENK